MAQNVLEVKEQDIHYLSTVSKNMGIPITWEQVNNYLFLGDVNGKQTTSGWKSARELGMDATYDELSIVDKIYQSVLERI